MDTTKTNISNTITLVVVLLLLMLTPLTAQHGETNKEKTDSLTKPSHSHQRNSDPRYSVFGPPKPAEWKFQLAYEYRKEEGVSAFTFYRKDQRNKTIFFTILDNAFDNINQYRVQRISGGASLFPINDDDRYQLDVGGIFDKIIDTTLYNNTLFSRFTWRPNRQLWMRVGFEYYDGYFLGQSGNIYGESSLSAYYFAAKYKMGFFSPVAVVGRGHLDEGVNNRFGGGAMLDGPFGLFLFGGYIKSTDETENTRTLALGRWAPFRPDGLPSAVFIWKHREDYDFQLGGIFFGRRNLFVRPAAVGMVTGMFVSNLTLRANTLLRQKKLMTITDDFQNSDFSVYYVHLNQKIAPTSSVGFTVVQFFKLFTETEFWVFNEPVLGLFYNEETNPTVNYNPITHKMEFGDETEKYWSFQIGSKIFDSFMFNIISEPSRNGWIVSASYLLK
ncbi:MAG: hypothetical protein L3J41_12495 [Melioribacteraceae bacterium]|nr:hypothetical protein [Melioribacteraceae bacterium]